MIKYFRRIREKLILDNRFNKYLIYAIGEIALVMIGILLALQVNNWNEHRKSLENGKEYIRLIYNDLKRDTNILNSLIDKLDEQLVASEKILKIYESKNRFIFDTLEFTKDWSISSWPLTVDRDQNTFSELKTSGMSILINDETLINSLNQFYNNYDSYIQNFNEFPKNVRLEKRIINMTSGNLSDFKTMLLTNLNTRNYIEVVLKNQKMYELLLGIYKSSYYNKIFFDNLLTEAKHIIKYIELKHADKIHETQ